MPASLYDAETRRFGRMLHGVGAVLTVAGGVLLYSLLYSPMVAATAQYREKIDLVKEKQIEAPQIRSEHAQLAERLSDFNERITRLRQRVPAEATEWDFLAQITQMAEEEGIRNPLTDMGRVEPGRGGQYSQISMSLRGLASYASLCRLVDRIRRLPRLSKLSELEIKTEFTGQEEYPVSLTLLIYFDLSVEEPDEVEGAKDA